MINIEKPCYLRIKQIYLLLFLFAFCIFQLSLSNGTIFLSVSAKQFGVKVNYVFYDEMDREEISDSLRQVLILQDDMVGAEALSRVQIFVITKGGEVLLLSTDGKWWANVADVQQQMPAYTQITTVGDLVNEAFTIKKLGNRELRARFNAKTTEDIPPPVFNIGQQSSTVDLQAEIGEVKDSATLDMRKTSGISEPKADEAKPQGRRRAYSTDGVNPFIWFIKERIIFGKT